MVISAIIQYNYESELNKDSMVNNNRRTKLLPKIIFGQLFFALIICALAFSVYFYTQGYRFSFDSLKVSKTGILLLDYIPKDAQVDINGKAQKRVGTFAKNLLPGFYNITVSEDGLVPWEISIEIEPESVNVYKSIILFNQEIVPAELTDASKISYLNSPTEVLATNASDNLAFNSNEIWVGEDLITRLSGTIHLALWYPDLAHIVYQQDKQIRLIEKNGQNDILLAELQTDAPARFAIGNRGSELYYLDNGKYMIAKIR